MDDDSYFALELEGFRRALRHCNQKIQRHPIIGEEKRGTNVIIPCQHNWERRKTCSAFVTRLGSTYCQVLRFLRLRDP